MSPRGELTRGRTAEGRTSPVEQSVGTGVPTHTPGPALSNIGCLDGKNSTEPQKITQKHVFGSDQKY